MQLSKIECVIKPFKLEAVKEALIGFGVSGLTISEVFSSCAGPPDLAEAQPGEIGSRRAGTLISLAPRIKIEMLLVRDQVSDVVAALVEAARTGNPGDGKVYVSSVDSIVRIRTGEKGIDAL